MNPLADQGIPEVDLVSSDWIWLGIASGPIRTRVLGGIVSFLDLYTDRCLLLDVALPRDPRFPLSKTYGLAPRREKHDVVRGPAWIGPAIDSAPKAMVQDESSPSCCPRAYDGSCQ